MTGWFTWRVECAKHALLVITIAGQPDGYPIPWCRCGTNTVGPRATFVPDRQLANQCGLAFPSDWQVLAWYARHLRTHGRVAGARIVEEEAVVAALAEDGAGVERVCDGKSLRTVNTDGHDATVAIHRARCRCGQFLDSVTVACSCGGSHPEPFRLTQTAAWGWLAAHFDDVGATVAAEVARAEMVLATLTAPGDGR